MREREIRTPNHKLLIGKLISTENGDIFFEFKSGKRSEQVSVEEISAQINDFIQEYTS